MGMSVGVSATSAKKSSTCLPWPPPKQSMLICVAESSLAVYCILFGYSEWRLVNPRPWLYFRPMRCLHGRTTGEPCGEMEKLTLFRGLSVEVRRDAEKLFARLAARLRELAAKEGA